VGIVERSESCTIVSPMFSDHVLLDILYVEGLMLNIKFSYLKVFDVTQDF